MASYHYGTTGETYYAKPEPLDVSPWDGDIVEGVENGTTGSFEFTLTAGTAYAIYLQAGASPASSDVIDGWFPAEAGGGVNITTSSTIIEAE